MKATYRKTHNGYIPVILHDDGRKEPLYGPPLASITAAIKYAELAIYNNRNRS